MLSQVSSTFQSSSAQLEAGHFLRPDSPSMVMIPIATTAASSWTNNVPATNIPHRTKGLLVHADYTSNKSSLLFNICGLVIQLASCFVYLLIPFQGQQRQITIAIALRVLQKHENQLIKGIMAIHYEVGYPHYMPSGCSTLFCDNSLYMLFDNDANVNLFDTVLPDFAQVYSFIGSVFDPEASDHLQRLKKMDRIDVETVCCILKFYPFFLSYCRGVIDPILIILVE